MNLANLAKLQGGYIHNPMIIGKPIELHKEHAVFNEMRQEFINIGYLNIDDTELTALLETIKKDHTEYRETIDMIYQYLLAGKYKEDFIELFKNQKFTQLASELACINISTIDKILVESLKRYKQAKQAPDELLDIYIQTLNDEGKYNELLCNATRKIEADKKTTGMRLKAYEEKVGGTEKERKTREEKMSELRKDIQRFEQIQTDEKKVIATYHQDKIIDISKLSKLIEDNVDGFFEDLPINKEKDKIINILQKYIDRKHYELLDGIVKSYLNNNKYYDFSNYISVFHKLIPYYKTFDRLSFVYDIAGNIVDRTNFKLFRVIDKNYYLLTGYDGIEQGVYKYFVINNNFIISEIPAEPRSYFKKTLAIIPAIFRYSELVELFYNLLNNSTILETFNDINMIYTSNQTPFKNNVKMIIDRSYYKAQIENFNDIIKYLFNNVDDVMLPTTSGNILNMFFYIGNLDFTFNILLNNNIYDIFDNIEFTQCIESQLDETKESGKEISFETLLSEMSKQLTEYNKGITLEKVIEMIQSIKTNAETKRYKLALIYLVKKLYSNIMIHNCVPTYNFIYIYNMINMLETNYNQKFNVSKINERLRELNKWVSKDSNEDKILFYLIFDILKCKVIFDKVTRMNKDIVIYAINTYMATMIQSTNIPFNINIFSNYIKGRYHELRPGKVPTEIDNMNKENMKLFKKEFRSISYKGGYVCNPVNSVQCVADCGESTILNILIYLLFDKETMLINSEWLPDNSLGFLKTFFNKYQTIDSIDVKDVRINKFNKHLQGFEFVYQGLDSFANYSGSYCVYQSPNYTNDKFEDTTDNKEDALARIVYDDMGNVIGEEIKYSGWELRPGYITIVRILNHILGYSKDKSPEESLDEKFLIKNLTSESLKNILMTFKNPNIENILRNYAFIGDKYDFSVFINFGELVNINFTYGHAIFPDITNDTNVNIIGKLKALSARDIAQGKNNYSYNPKRYYLLSSVKKEKFNSLGYLGMSNLLTIFLTPKNKITRTFRKLIYKFINASKNEFNFIKYIGTPELDYICELIKFYENRYYIMNINPKFNSNHITWFCNRFKGFYDLPKMENKLLTILDLALESDILTFEKWIQLIECHDENWARKRYKTNNTIGNIILKSRVKLYNKMKDKLELVTNLLGNNPLHFAYMAFNDLQLSANKKVIVEIIKFIEQKYGKSYYNNKNRLNKYPIENLLFSQELYDEKFIINSLKSNKMSTLIEIISNNYVKFDSLDSPNLSIVIQILPKLLKGDDNLMQNIYDLFIVSFIHLNEMIIIDSVNLFFSIEYIKKICTFMDDLMSRSVISQINRLNTQLVELIYRYHFNLINTTIFKGQDDETRDRIIFPYIYNNNILKSETVRRYITDDATITKFKSIRDFNGDTIYHYIAKYTIYNYGNEINRDIKSLLYDFFKRNPENINNIINNAGLSVIDILSILPIHFESVSIPFLENHFRFLNEYYDKNGFNLTNMVIPYRHVISKIFYAFKSANNLLTSINTYIIDKQDIDNYFICLSDRGLYLYTYCDRLTSEDLKSYLKTYYESKKSRTLNIAKLRNLYTGMISYDTSVKPLHPFPKKIWYKLLGVNSPLSEFTIPIKNKLKNYNRLIGRSKLLSSDEEKDLQQEDEEKGLSSEDEHWGYQDDDTYLSERSYEEDDDPDFERWDQEDRFRDY